MIRGYDLVAALAFSWVLLNLAVIPYIGFVAAYLFYETIWEKYCKWRLTVEK